MADMMALRFVDKPLESRMMANYQVRFGEGRLEKQVMLLAGRLLDLFGINADRVKPEIRDRVIRYQEECYRALAGLLTEHGPGKNHYQSVFNELYRRFGVTSYKLVPQAKYPAVLAFLEEWRGRASE